MTPRQKLWQHLHDEHGLLLLGSELEEIIMLAKEIIESDVLSESNAGALPRRDSDVGSSPLLGTGGTMTDTEMIDRVDEWADEGLYVVPSETHFLHPATERRLRDVIRQIDDGIGGGFTFPHWLSNIESMEAAKYFVTGCKDDCASLWYAPRGRAIRDECTHVAYTIQSLQNRRYAELAQSLEKHLGREPGLRICGKCDGSGRLYPGGHEDSEGIQCWRCGGKGELPNAEAETSERSE